MPGGGTVAMPGTAPSNQVIVFEGPYPFVSLSFFEYIHQKQDLREPQSYLIGCDWSTGQGK